MKQLTIDDRQVKYAARIVYEEVNFYPTGDNGEFEEDTRVEIYSEELVEGPSQEEAKGVFDNAILRYHDRGNLLKGQAKDLAVAIAYGFKQPEAVNNLTELDMSLIVSEIAHSMNRKGMIKNDNIEEFIHMIKETI